MAAVATRIRQEAIVPYHVPAPALKAPRGSSQAPPLLPASSSGRKRARCDASTTQKLERCKTQAQHRRMTQKGLMEELASLLPFPREVTSQMDTKTVLRLAVCYFRVKSLVGDGSPSPSPTPSDPTAVAAVPTSSNLWPVARGGSTWGETNHPSSTWATDGERMWAHLEQYNTALSPLGLGVLQDLMIEALQGFIMVVSCDGTILYLSDSVFTHTGLFQSENTGRSVYSLVHEEDHVEVREALNTAEAAALSSGKASCSFFCRMKSKKKNSHLKAPGHKLVYVSGHCKVHQLETYMACTVHIVSAPSVLEIRMEGNAFTTRHSLEMKVIFYDERLKDVMGYSKKDLIGQSLFSLHHHDDLAITTKCSKSLHEKGEAVTGYYRLLTNYGTYVWVQSRGTMVMDRRTGKPSQLLCMHFIVEKEKGDQSLKLRNLLSAEHSPAKSSNAISMDPIPVPREDGAYVNPLPPSSPTSADAISPPPSVDSWSSDAPVIKLSSPAISFADFPQSGMVSGPIPIPIPSPRHQQLYPTPDPSPHSSNPWSNSTPALSNYSTPAVSPRCSEDTSPSSYSHSGNLRSVPGSATPSPRPVPDQMNPDPSSLDAILQELMGLNESGLANTEPPLLALSPDSGCTDLENYLLSLANDSLRSSLSCTPARSPLASSSNPPLGGYINPSSSAPSPLGGYVNPSSTAPSPLGGYINPSSTAHSPLGGYTMSINPSSTTLLSPQECYFNPSSTAPINPSSTSTHTLRGLLAESSIHGQLS